ncbi:MAG: hypothetical protein B1H06_01900 [Candidatus Cloacimonas sp. 4484_143]|nr:MAG: hypothetical protein B1H06_01900 [Candidatus Cloacimonas sp. 4484_143]RLC57699.1 MAG: hypothetical protein DRH89_02925 [Candidatus Cloacimonadota bacterium]
MKYGKSPLSFSQQAELLIKRGLLSEKEELINILSKINYYRLSAYWKQFQDKTEKFYAHISLNDIMQFYQFDEKLRNIIFMAITQIEVSLKTAFANKSSLYYKDSFFYLDINKLPKLRNRAFEYDKLMKSIDLSCRGSNELYYKHFQIKYGDYHNFPPIWMLIEIISFGSFCKLFSSVNFNLGKEISQDYGLNYNIMNSWIWSLNEVRNICAHHSRLWNRTLGNKPKIPNKKNLEVWYKPAQIKNDKIFSIIFILLLICNNADLDIKWFEQLVELLDSYPKIPIKQMGFIDNWEENSIISKYLKD